MATRYIGAGLAGRRVLVTGASGFIGAHLVRRLAVHGVQVAGLSRTRGRLENEDAPWTPICCDLKDSARLRDVLGSFEPQVVFHFASHPDARESAAHTRACVEDNVLGTLNLLEALRPWPGISLVYGDSVKVYGTSSVPHRSGRALEPLNAYAITKLAGWNLCDMYRRLHGMYAVAVRPTLIYGPGQGYNLVSFLCEAVWSEQAVIRLDGGSQTRDPVFIDDAVDAFLLAAERCPALSGQVIHIGGGREMAVADLARLTVGLLGSAQEVVPMPNQARPTEMWRSWCDNTEAGDLLGWAPQVTLEEGILKTAEYFQTQRRVLTLGEGA